MPRLFYAASGAHIGTGIERHHRLGIGVGFTTIGAQGLDIFETGLKAQSVACIGDDDGALTDQGLIRLIETIRITKPLIDRQDHHRLWRETTHFPGDGIMFRRNESRAFGLSQPIQLQAKFGPAAYLIGWIIGAFQD